MPVIFYLSKKDMATRAAICIGVDRAEGMAPLTAAAKGAQEFADWATAQGCDVHVLTDQQGQEVSLNAIFKAVRAVVEAATYAQLYIYFSGHGILIAPGTEYWLLSGAPCNPNEAVNLFRCIEAARESGIPHVIFVSDACRSAVQGAPLNGVIGGGIFPNQTTRAASGEVDVFYATQPGDPAYEVPETQATQQYRGLFTDCLLTAVRSPASALAELVPASTPPLAIITSRSLKPHLEKQVLQAATQIRLTLHQKPQIRVETASPKYFAVAPALPLPSPPADAKQPFIIKYTLPTQQVVRATRGLGSPQHGLGGTLRLVEAGIGPEVARLRRYAKYLPADTDTGFTVIGTALVAATASPEWTLDNPPPATQLTAMPGAHYLRALPVPNSGSSAAPPTPAANTVLLEFAGGVGTLLALLPGFVGVVVVERGRVVSVNYLPASTTPEHQGHDARAAAWEELKAIAAVTARQGNFTLLDQPADQLAIDLHRPALDPTMALYLGYAYAQRGQADLLVATQHQLATDENLPLLFDLALLTRRVHATPKLPPLAPLTPMLAQGWALLAPDSPLHQPWHDQLRPYLVPSLWSTYTSEGLALARTILFPSV